jgi:hypothetical protein
MAFVATMMVVMAVVMTVMVVAEGQKRSEKIFREGRPCY